MLKFLSSKQSYLVCHTIALHWACGDGDVELVKMLVDAGADVHEVNAFGNTPLHLAAAQGAETAVEAMLAAGADVKRGMPRARNPS